MPLPNPKIHRLRAFWVAALQCHRFDVLIDGVRFSDRPLLGRVFDRNLPRGGGWVDGWLPSEAESYLARRLDGEHAFARALLDKAPAPKMLEPPKGWAPESSRKVRPMSGAPAVRGNADAPETRDFVFSKAPKQT